MSPEAIAAIANAPAVTTAMLAAGLAWTSLSEPARYSLGCIFATNGSDESLQLTPAQPHWLNAEWVLQLANCSQET